MSEYINKEAAIDLIESMIADKGVAFNPHKLAMALKDMESVEIPEAKDTDLISRQAAIELACWRCKKCERQDCEHKDSCETMRLLDALPSEDPKPPMLNKDCISRQAAIEAVMKYFIDEYNKMPYEYDEEVKDNVFTDMKWVNISLEHNKEIRKVLKSLPPVEPKPVCEDAISKKWLEDNAKEFGDYYENTVYAVPLSILESAPRVIPERPKGEWKIRECDSIYGKKYILTCTKCGESVSVTEEALPHENFCRECGADMRGDKE